MKKSELRQLIREEIDAYKQAQDTLNAKIGVQPTTAKNTFKEKEYEVEYWEYIDDDYESEYIKVKAKDEAEALAKAKEELKQSGKRNIRYDKLKVVK